MGFDGDEDIDASPQSEKISATDTGLAASALGIVGNVARWGNLDQIQVCMIKQQIIFRNLFLA